MNQHVRPPSGAVPQAELTQSRYFLARALPWPEGEESYIDVIWAEKPDDAPYDPKKLYWKGRAVRTVKDALYWVQQPLTNKNTVAVYACMSSQKEAEEKKSQRGNKYYNAIRNQPNAVKLKSFFIDLDHKGQDKNSYNTPDEAIAALATVIKNVGLPKPTMIVDSGGGYHVHWVVSSALTPEEWLPWAHALVNAARQNGLKFDSGCTIDSARVLRIPQTYNYKYGDPPRPVKFAGTPLDWDYNLDRITKVLEPYKVVVPTTHVGNNFLEDPSLFPPKTPVEDELGAGIEPAKAPPVALDDVAKECRFVRDAINTGGAAYTNPLWNLTTLIATFTTGGNADAHRMGCKHPDYSQESTDSFYERKEREKEEKNLGWPSCATISGSGCTACQTCPHFSAGKSPLNLARQSLPAQVTAPTSSVTFVDPWSEFIGPPFPLRILPLPLKNFVEAEHKAMGADPSALAMAALAAVAGAIHAETRARAGDGWREPPILWVGLIGPPSAMKSPIIRKATAHLRAIDHQRHQTYAINYASWKQSKAAAGKASAPPPPPPKPGRLVIEDVTPEKVAEILSRDSAGSLLIHDELAGWFGGFERYNSGQASRAFYLSCWNGGPYLKDRVGQGARDESAEIRVPNLALGVLGGIQPDRLATQRDLTCDGMLQRFLPLLMRLPERGDENHPVVAAENDYAKFIGMVHSAHPRIYEFAPDAAGVRTRVLDRLFGLEQVEGFSSALIGAIGKLRGYYIRLALTLHVAAENTAMMRGQAATPGGFILRETAEAAEMLLFKFLLPHIFGLYDVISNGGKDRDIIRTIAGFILASDEERFLPSDITAGVRKLRGEPSKTIAEWACRFCAMGWLRPEDETAPVAKAWLVVPGLRDHFAERRKQAQKARAQAHAILSAGGTRR
jgi:hypothetical protein